MAVARFSGEREGASLGHIITVTHSAVTHSVI